MVNGILLAVAAVTQEQLVGDMQNFLARVVRNVVRLANGHETLIIVVLILLLVIYLYLQKA